MSFNKRTIVVKCGGHKKQTLAIINGKSILDLLLGSKIEINHSCGGQASCGTCKVVLDKSDDNSLPMNDLELEYFQFRERQNHHRLSCQIFPNESLTIEIPQQSLPK